MIYIPVPGVNRAVAIPENVPVETIEEAMQLIVPVNPQIGATTRFGQATVLIAYADAHGYQIFQGM